MAKNLSHYITPRFLMRFSGLPACYSTIKKPHVPAKHFGRTFREIFRIFGLLKLFLLPPKSWQERAFSNPIHLTWVLAKIPDTGSCTRPSMIPCAAIRELPRRFLPSPIGRSWGQHSRVSSGRQTHQGRAPYLHNACPLEVWKTAFCCCMHACRKRLVNLVQRTWTLGP